MTITAPNEHRAPVVVRSEPLTYTERGQHSYFMDLARSSRGDWQSKERLARHQKEAESRAVQYDTARAAAEAEGIEFRVAPNTTDATGGEFAPPQWLIDKFATVPRNARVVANLIGSNTLPQGTNQINIPRVTTGTAVQTQTTEASAVSSIDLITSSSSSTVVTIAGDIDISQQLLDLTPAGFDVAAYRMLQSAYDERLDIQLIRGTGTGQLTGLTNVTSINTVSGASGTTIATTWPLLGQAAAAIGNNRLLPMQNWVMAPRRFAWLLSLLDTGNAPLNPYGTDGFYGFPIAQAGGLLTLSTAVDQIIGFRPDDCYLWESDPHLAVVTNALSGTLQVRIQLRRYVAAILGLYPTGIAAITALPAPSNF